MPRTIRFADALATLLPLCGFAITLMSTTPAAADGPNCTEDICARWADPVAATCRIAGTNAMNGGSTRNGNFIIRRDILDIGVEFDRERPDGCFTNQRPYALQGFVLFMGNHSVDRMHILQSPGQFDVGLRDGDGGDLTSGVVWATPLPSDTPVRIIEFDGCSHHCEWVLNRFSDDPLPEGIPVILGFDLNRDGGDGGHVQRISVSLRQSPQGPRLIVRFGESDWLVSGTVQVGWVDPSVVLSPDEAVTFEYRGHEEEESPASADEVHYRLRADAAFPGHSHALRSFSFWFRNSGHFLGYVGIEPDGDQYEAWMQDEQPDDDFRFPDDPFVASATYVVMRPFVEAITDIADFGPVMVVD